MELLRYRAPDYLGKCVFFRERVATTTKTSRTTDHGARMRQTGIGGNWRHGIEGESVTTREKKK